MAELAFQDFVVVVTGASADLGRAIAVQTAAQGAKAVLVNYARNGQEAEETVRHVQAQGAIAWRCRTMWPMTRPAGASPRGRASRHVTGEPLIVDAGRHLGLNP